MNTDKKSDKNQDDKINIGIESDKNKRKNKFLLFIRGMFAVLTLMLILSTYVLFNRNPRRKLLDERRMVSKVPSLTNDDGSFNDDIVSDTYDWIGDNLGLRRQYTGKARMINSRIFLNKKAQGAEKGLNGWFYAAFDNNLNIAYGDYPLKNGQIATLKKEQINMKKWCEKRGIKYYFCVVPSKSSIYPEYIMSRKCRVRTTPCDRVYEALKGNVDVIDLKKPMLRERKHEQIFLKKNTHWTPEGAYLAYKVIYKFMGHDDPVSVHTVDSEFPDDLVRYAGLTGQIPDKEKTKDVIIDSPQAVLKEAPVKTYDGSYFTNSSGKKGYVMILGDSYSATPAYHFLNYFAESFARTRFVYNNHEADFHQIEKEHPDCLIVQLSERELNQDYSGMDPNS